MQKSSQPQDKKNLDKDRALMLTISDAKLLTVLTIEPIITPGTWVHALDNTHSPFDDIEAPPRYHRTSCGTRAEGFLKINEGTIC